MTLTIAVDVDGVCADLLAEWLRRYNADYKDDLCPHDVKRWELDEFVVPECGKKIYSYLTDPTLYDNVAPLPGALRGVQELRKLGHRVVFVTSCNAVSAASKICWLKDHDFIAKSDEVICLVGKQGMKDLVKADLLIDDYVENVWSWGDRAILYDAPYNEEYTGEFYRAFAWPDIISIVDAFQTEDFDSFLSDETKRFMGEMFPWVMDDSQENILEEANRLVHGNRRADYGHPIVDYGRTGRMWGAILGIPDIDPRICCLMMAAVKISREVQGHKRDNLTDLAGYAECASMVAERQEELKAAASEEEKDVWESEDGKVAIEFGSPSCKCDDGNPDFCDCGCP